MAKIYLVRHGRAASGWGLEKDPGLDELGRSQAKAAAQKLAPRGPFPIITSPLKRARETAAPLAEIWQSETRIEPRAGEIPFPSETPINRVGWLKEVMAGHWSNLDRKLRAWRQDVIQTICSITPDSVIFSHFIAINVAVGFAVEDDRVVIFRPDNASITILETKADRINLIRRGDEADTRVN
jgi:broad specificity phosphatase PhoE